MDRWDLVVLELIRSPWFRVTASLTSLYFCITALIDLRMFPLKLRKTEAEIDKLKLEVEIMQCHQPIKQ